MSQPPAGPRRVPQALSPRRSGARLRSRLRRLRWASRLRLERAAKRTLDIVASGSAILVFSPFIAFIAAAIKFHDGGPVLFWQTRVGRFGRHFAFPKFRSMCVDAEARKAALMAANDHGEAGVTFKMKRDPRVTPIGRFLRRTSLDELPQLLCVLRGHMSLVGPRPPVPSEVEHYTLAQRRRLDVTPGLTCIWQVSGRGEIPFDRQVELDIDYIESRNTALDVELIAKTVPAVIGGKGAY
ncbi:MAG: sugar transferase [Acidobacteriota bacterium]